MTSVAVIDKPQTAEPVKFDTKAAEMVTKAVTAIVLDDPFYGYLLLRQEIVQDPTCETASTNGKSIRYNPKFVRAQTLPKLKGLFKHEVMHIALMHHVRRQERDPEKWNRAADYVINAHLVKAGVDLPDGGLVDPQYEQHSTEHVYNMIPDVYGNGPSNGPNWNWGGVEDAPGTETEEGRKQVEEDTRTEVIQAANTAKMMGKLPAGIERLVDKLRESKMPWRQLLARFFRATAKADYSWLRPNRRFLAHNIYLPSLHSEALGPLVIGVDTSGSVGHDELTQFFGCINGILKQCKPEAVHVIYCDAAVGSTQVFYPRQYPLTASKFKPTGGGGTDFRPVFDYVAKNKINPVALLYLTDGYGVFPNKAPSYPVIWCMTTEVKGTFGKTVEIQ